MLPRKLNDFLHKHTKYTTIPLNMTQQLSRDPLLDKGLWRWLPVKCQCEAIDASEDVLSNVATANLSLPSFRLKSVLSRRPKPPACSAAASHLHLVLLLHGPPPPPPSELACSSRCLWSSCSASSREALRAVMDGQSISLSILCPWPMYTFIWKTLAMTERPLPWQPNTFSQKNKNMPTTYCNFVLHHQRSKNQIMEVMCFQ